ncbi:phospholipase D/nuclease [Durotheca rogersii]|uniref:phospholipase D/nuclease n=1 Tax=Durotheca rogersii TaxID=419775 RepID=UPI00221E9DD5|nr:phospholipase D/nuclease [Durotheca rogersii]KAI5865155.1 phospholipase D/nuclease [Durotheca rogersii]
MRAIQQGGWPWRSVLRHTPSPSPPRRPPAVKGRGLTTRVNPGAGLAPAPVPSSHPPLTPGWHASGQTRPRTVPASPPSSRHRWISTSASRPASLITKNPFGERRVGQVKPRARKGMMTPSPFRLTTVAALPNNTNVETVSVRDVLGDPLISECWSINDTHDIPWFMSQFHKGPGFPTTVHIIQGLSTNLPEKHALLEQKESYSNVVIHDVYSKAMTGTHHTKMLVLFRRDLTAQVVVHTAQMTRHDWDRHTNGVWLSPPLPLLPHNAPAPTAEDLQIGRGARFKHDLLNYLRSYDDNRGDCRHIIHRLAQHDFSAVRGAFIGSVPGRHVPRDVPRDPSQTQWGWPGLRQALEAVPGPEGGQVVMQTSSVGSLGDAEEWLGCALGPALTASGRGPSEKPNPNPPKLQVVFPTPDEIRRSVDGYASGKDLRIKIKPKAHAGRFKLLRPMLHRWSGRRWNITGEDPMKFEGQEDMGLAGRSGATPHINMYVRYQAGGGAADWALLTSASVSAKSWGEAPRAGDGTVAIGSWEAGVLVWPALYAAGARMVPVYRTDTPVPAVRGQGPPLVGLRIPYGLPLMPYDADDTPWVASTKHDQLDWLGNKWVPPPKGDGAEKPKEKKPPNLKRILDSRGYDVTRRDGSRIRFIADIERR